MKAFLVQLAYDLRAGFRSPTRLLMSYLFPLGFYAMMGAVMPKLNPGFSELMVPSMAIFCLLSGAFFVLPGLLVDARTSGIHRGMHIHGVPALAVIGTPALATLLHGLLAATVVGLTGPALFDGAAPVHWGGFLFTLVCVALSMVSLGVLIGVVAPTTPASMIISQAVFLPSMLLGGIMIGQDALPASLQPVSALMPTSWAMQSYWSFAAGADRLVAGPVAIAVLLGSGALALALALWLFAWDTQGRERRAPPALALLAVVPFVLGSLVFV